MLNFSFLSHPADDTFPSQLPFSLDTLEQLSATKIDAVPWMLCSFQLLSGIVERQGRCGDVMGWKEAKHQFVRDDFFLNWFYSNRKLKLNYSMLHCFFSIIRQKSKTVSRKERGGSGDLNYWQQKAHVRSFDALFLPSRLPQAFCL